MKNKNGITLIALVITIVVLIILAGVAINLTLGENGILNKAQQAKQKQSEAESREKLELVLSNARIEKETNTSYNDEYLNSMLEAKGIAVDGDYVIVDNYNYLIDREQLIIKDSLGETQIKVTTKVEEYLGKNANNKYEANLLLTVESNAGLQTVVVTKTDATTTEVGIEEAKTGKSMTVELDVEYIVTVTTKDGKATTRKIVEKSEETISSVAELVAFRDAVNSGLTYEGKTISLTQDIDLSSVCGENVNGQKISWEPIGTETNPFMGTFDGNRYTIEKIYINTAKDYQGLFGNIKYSEIKNLTITDGSIVGKACTAGIVGDAFESNILKCSNSISISGITETTGGICGNALNTRIENCTNSGVIVGGHSVGGVAGTIRNSQILQSYNKNIVKTNDSTSPYNVYTAGGIVGVILGASDKEMSIIENSYNIGDIYGYTSSSGIIAWIQGGGEFYINNCYSIGKITGNQKYAIYSYKTSWGVNSPKLIQLSNNYWITGCGASSGSYDYGNTNATSLSTTEMQNLALTLGDAYVADGKIKNSNGEWVDNVDESGNIIYINDGYPILKWQVEE